MYLSVCVVDGEGGGQRWTNQRPRHGVVPFFFFHTCTQLPVCIVRLLLPHVAKDCLVTQKYIRGETLTRSFGRLLKRRQSHTTGRRLNSLSLLFLYWPYKLVASFLFGRQFPSDARSVLCEYFIKEREVTASFHYQYIASFTSISFIQWRELKARPRNVLSEYCR